jgi:hypothetical protein
VGGSSFFITWNFWVVTGAVRESFCSLKAPARRKGNYNFFMCRLAIIFLVFLVFAFQSIEIFTNEYFIIISCLQERFGLAGIII